MRASHEDNKVCFECGAQAPQWSSINNAILICLTCCGVHRGMGIQVSLVRSLTLDMWTEKQLKLLQAGGNHRMAEWQGKYKLRDVDMKVRYTTKAMQFYRRRHEAIALEREFSEAEPSFEEGRKLPTGESLDQAPPTAPASADDTPSEVVVGLQVPQEEDDEALEEAKEDGQAQLSAD